MAGAVNSRLAILAARGVYRVVVLLDREDRADCPGDLATALIQALQPMCARQGVREVRVVIKDRMLENWLIADTGCIRQMKNRFRFSEGVLRKIEKDGADNQAAFDLLKRFAHKQPYSKVPDSMRIMERAQPLAIAGNSRSFRRLLRVLNHGTYSKQSKRPAA